MQKWELIDAWKSQEFENLPIYDKYLIIFNTFLD